jgi:hypothetical protein
MEGTMEFKDENGWKEYEKTNSTDDYSKEVVNYSKRWAELMEEKMEAGEKIVDMAASTSHDADTDGITGYMYGAAVSGLAAFWKHGEELRRWHNLDTQIGSEGERANKSGGTLNPALLNVEI